MRRDNLASLSTVLMKLAVHCQRILDYEWTQVSTAAGMQLAQQSRSLDTGQAPAGHASKKEN